MRRIRMRVAGVFKNIRDRQRGYASGGGGEFAFRDGTIVHFRDGESFVLRG